MHIKERRRLVVKIFAEQGERGILVDKDLILIHLATCGYKTSQRTLERDIAFIFANNPSAMLGGFNPMRKINPGKKYWKIIKDHKNTESIMRVRSWINIAGSDAAVKLRNKKMEAVRKEIDVISDATIEYPE